MSGLHLVKKSQKKIKGWKSENWGCDNCLLPGEQILKKVQLNPV